MKKYFLLALFTIALVLVGCNDDNSSSPLKISGWGTPPPIVTPTTTDEAKEMLNLSAQVSDEFMSNIQTLRETMDADPAIQKAIDDLKNNPDVVAVSYQYKSLYIYTRLGDKVVVLLDSEYRNNPTTNTEVTTLSTSSFDTSNNTMAAMGAAHFDVPNKSLVSLKHFKRGISTSSDGTFTTQSIHPFATGRKALILSGYQINFGEDLCPIKEALEKGGFLVNFVVDKEMCGVPATTFDKEIINYVSKLHRYDVVYFNTHGNTNLLSLGIPYDSDNPPLELLTFKLNPGVHLSASGKELMIDSAYISHTFKDANKFRNTLIFTDSCLGGKVKSHLADAFLDSGAAVYVGYNNTTQYNKQTPQFSSPFFEMVSQVDTSVAKALKEPNNLPTHWTSKTEQDCFLFLFGCQTVETEGVDVKVYKNQKVQDDPEGFILVPFVYAITNISPNVVLAGDTITIKGRNFDGETHSVYFYHRKTALMEFLPITSFTDNQIEATIPESVAANYYEVYVGDYILHSNADAVGYRLTVQEERLINPGTVQGLVKDAVSGNPLSGVLIKVRRPDNFFVSERTTNSNGIYEIVLSEGSYVLEISLVGYIPATVYVDITRDELTTVTELRHVPQAQSGNGNVSGQLLNAFNGEGVSNITLHIRRGHQVQSGEVFTTIVTDGQGNYNLDLPAGNYTIEALKDGYISQYFSMVSIGGSTTTNQNASITPTINIGETRFVLTWDERPGDLDSHLLTPDGTDIYWKSRGNQSSSPYTELDVDRTNIVTGSGNVTFGPETITIYKPQSGTYRYFVHDYSAFTCNRKPLNDNDAEFQRDYCVNPSPGISSSSAKVQIYFENRLVKEYNAPLYGTGLYWNVFSYDGSTGTITTIDQITSVAPTTN